MAHLEYRVGDDDVAKYGDEWFKLDLEALMRLRPASEVIALEQELAPYTIGRLIEDKAFGRKSALASLACLWIARRQAGQVEAFADLDVQVLMIRERLVDGGDGDPPSDGPAQEASPAT